MYLFWGTIIGIAPMTNSENQSIPTAPVGFGEVF
jgi:hypothetical protein